MDVGVEASDMFPVREVESFGLQGVAQFEQRVGAAHLLQGEHIGFEGEDALADFGFRIGELGGAGFGGLIEIVFHVVGGDAEGFRGGQLQAERQGEQEDCGAEDPRMQVHGAGNKRRARASQKGFSRKGFCKMVDRCYVSTMFKPSENGSARSRRRPAGAQANAKRKPLNLGNGSARRSLKRGHHASAALVKLHDKQSERDHRELRIDKVGVRGLRFPIQVRDKARAVQNTVATIGMFVDLPKEFKGTHMSRFLEVLNAHGNVIHVENITDILYAMQEKFQAATSHLEIEFPYFMVKQAPVTGKESVMDYLARFDAAACHKEICSC